MRLGTLLKRRRIVEEAIKVGDTVEVEFYGKMIRGKVEELGKFTGKPIKMRREDTGRIHAIIGGGTNLRKVR
jgi:hypothetical protein